MHLNWLLLILIIGSIVTSILFYIGANKVNKNGFLWGLLGLLAYLISYLILAIPIKFVILESNMPTTSMYYFAYFIEALVCAAVAAFVATVIFRKKLQASPSNDFVVCAECGSKCRASAAFCAKCGNSIKQG